VVIVVDKMVLAQVSIIPLTFWTHIHPHVALTGRQTGEAWEPPKSSAFSEMAEQLGV
jgi:hypothetical protein